MMRAYDKLMLFIREQWRERRPAIGGGDLFVEMSGVLAFPGRAIEGINVLEVRGRGIQTMTVDDQAAIVADAHALAAKGDEALDVKLPPIAALHPLDSASLEHDDFAAFRPAEIIGQPIHKQVIATVSFQANDVFALFQNFSRRNGIPQLVRRE